MTSQPHALRTYPPGVPCWVDTEQPDVDAATSFYGGLFGWTFQEAMPPGAPGRYVIARLAGRDAAGIASAGEEPPAWNTYVAVDDADAVAEKLTAMGATVRSAPADAGEGGRSATMIDPEGTAFRIWQPRRRLGVQAANEPGGWNFSDLRTRESEAAIAFYTKAFGWEFDDVGFATLIRQPGYGDHLQNTIDPEIRTRQAGVAPPGFEDAIAWLEAPRADEQAHWHVTFTVADRDRTAAQAQRLGAEVLSQDDSDWTRTALIRDPQGAVFTASQFRPPAR